ncbi:hypothetical protein BC628DRAFT_1037885 [Trametes gibbosa]|nr:hypothetical protein BC628DRAFT_1037885 [Trametes gibbosa]
MTHSTVAASASDNPFAALLGSQLGAIQGFLGTLLLGTVFAVMLYGLSVHQTYTYYRDYPTDIKLLKGLVLILFLLDTVHTAFSIDSCYFYLVTNSFNPLGLQLYHISLKVIAPITGISTLFCQLFYMRRVYMFKAGHISVLIIAGLFILARIGFLIATCIRGFETVYLQTYISFSRIVSSGSFGCDLVADTIITTALVVHLLRSRTGFRR